MKKKVLIGIFLIYWISLIVSMIFDFSIFNLFIYIIAILPLTIAIVLEKDVLALFIIILLGAFYTLQCALGIIGIIVDFKFSIDIFLSVFGLCFFMFIIISSIKILCNKKHLDTLYLILSMITYLVVLCISFVRDLTDEILLNTSYFVSTISLYVLISLYLLWFNDKKIVIFK